MICWKIPEEIPLVVQRYEGEKGRELFVQFWIIILLFGKDFICYSFVL